jgi:hypothetical protein
VKPGCLPRLQISVRNFTASGRITRTFLSEFNITNPLIFAPVFKKWSANDLGRPKSGAGLA